METSKTPPVYFEELWRRVGLVELRQALGRAQTLIQRFEETLKKLPSCDECAHENLKSSTPDPCKCPAGDCTCHG